MIFAVDVDDVLADTIPTFISFLNERYNTQLSHQDFTDYHWWHLMGCTKEEAFERWYAFVQSDAHKTMPPVAGAVETMHELAKHAQLVCLTGRATRIKDATESWIAQQFPGVFSSIHYTNYLTGEKEHSKGHVAKEIGAQGMFEDHAEHANSCAAMHIPTILFTRPWNVHEDVNANVIRVPTWKEARAAATHLLQ